MNSHQRRKFSVWKHYTMPLESAVRVRICGQVVPATMFKHDSQHPHSCIVKLQDGTTRWVTLACVKPVRRLRVRPWWRVLHEKLRRDA